MPLSNRDIVLRGFASFNSGDWDAATRGLHPDFVWVSDPETARLTAAVYEEAAA